MTTYLVTGGAGFIGSHFVNTVLRTEPGAVVVNLDKLTYSGNLANLSEISNEDRHVFIHGDICDEKLVGEIFSNYEIDCVVNFAAESHVDRSIEDSSPFLKTNVVGTGVLLDAAVHQIEKGNQIKFLQISTDEVYGSLDDNLVADESFPLQPGNPYSASKAAADLLALSYFNTYGLPVLITRCCNNFGPGQYGEKFIPVVINSLVNHVDIPLYGSGLNKREWIYADDHCDRLLDVISLGVPGEIYNVGSGQIYSNEEIANIIIGIYCMKIKTDVRDYRIEYVTDRKGHDMRYALDMSKGIKKFGWSPISSIEDNLEQTIAALSVNNE